MKLPAITSFLSLACFLCVLTIPVQTYGAEEDTAAMKSRIEALERELSAIKEKLEEQTQEAATKEELEAVKEEVEVAKAEKDEWKYYDSKVHLAGYASVGFVNDDPENDRFNQVAFSPIFHYQYKNLILLEAELEIEIEDDDTEVALEYMTVDWLMNDYMALVAGKFLSPIGQFRQNLHPSWINKLPSAPSGFGHEQAAPIADVGVQLRGGVPIFRGYGNYAVFVTNGPELDEDGGEIHAVHAEGSTSNDDDNFLFGGRIGIIPIPKLEIGASAAFGDVALEDEDDRDYEVYGFDASWKWRDLEVRGEYVKQEVGSLATSVAPEEQDWEAWYAQASHRVLSTNFEAVVRYSDYTSTHASVEQEQWALGLNYLFAPNAIAKFSYEFNDGADGEPTNDDLVFLQFAYGF
ncbi:MAG: porin [Candidatus Dadabacteria bacterium]|nr:porin [Candidatus Dadabacteria bacterium]